MTNDEFQLGEHIGLLTITSVGHSTISGVCEVCNEIKTIPKVHARKVVAGKGGGCKCSRRRYTVRPELWWRYTSYLQSATKKNLEFEISFEDFVAITQRDCVYCGEPPELRPSHGKRWNFTFPMSGMDRVDSSVGYLHNNVVPSCSKCNQAKWNTSKKDFFSWVKKVYEFNKLEEIYG